VSVSESKLLEYRVMRLLFYRGFFVRRHLTLKSYFYPESVDVTDIDVLGIRFSDDFSPEVTICECKSGRSNGTVDRVLWLLGLSKYFGAHTPIIIRQEISGKIKNFANEVGVFPLDLKNLKELEQQNEIVENEWVGPFDFEYYDKRLEEYYRLVKNQPNLSKIYWFLRSRFWYTDNSTRLKQAMTALEIALKNIESDVNKWLIYETSILLSLALMYLCNQVYTLNKKERETYITNILTTGLGSPEIGKKILDATYGLVTTLIREKTGESIYLEEKYLRLVPPEYTKALIDLIDRLIQKPNLAINVPRFLDLICYEYLMKGKEIDYERVKKIFPEKTDFVAKLSKNVIRFLITQRNIPQEMYENLLNF